MKEAPLGRASRYPDRYSPELLYAVDRAENRLKLGLENGWPWFGEDRWQAFELSWLKPSGMPQVAIGEFLVPASAPNLIESKSLKLYCNSFNQAAFEDEAAVQRRMEEDLSEVAGARVGVSLATVDSPVELLGRPTGFSLLDDQSVDLSRYAPSASSLRTVGPVRAQHYCSHLLKSNCPVTGQPDWGSIFISLEGRQLDTEGLLAYIVGYRKAQEFHEHCVESIFMDLMHTIGPTQLTVSAQYTRRGGLDINPWRSTEPGHAPKWRLARQ